MFKRIGTPHLNFLQFQYPVGEAGGDSCHWKYNFQKMGDIEYTSHPEVRKSERDYIYFISLFNLLTVLSVTTNWCDTKPWFEIWCTNFSLPAASHSYPNMIQNTTQGSLLQGLQLVFIISHATPKYFQLFFMYTVHWIEPSESVVSSYLLIYGLTKIAQTQRKRALALLTWTQLGTE